MSNNLEIEGIGQIALSCANLERSIEFYRDRLNLQFTARFDPPGIAFFSVGTVRLFIQQSPNAAGNSSVVYFKVADIDQAAALLLNDGIEFEQSPALVFADDAGQFGPAGEEEWIAFFRDPDGNMLALVARKIT